MKGERKAANSCAKIFLPEERAVPYYCHGILQALATTLTDPAQTVHCLKFPSTNITKAGDLTFDESGNVITFCDSGRYIKNKQTPTPACGS